MNSEPKYLEIQRNYSDFATSLPPKIYKARSWAKPYHQEILRKRELYFSRVEEFEDKYDCRFPIRFDFSYNTLYEALYPSILDQLKQQRILPTPVEIEVKARFQYKRRFETAQQQEDREADFYRISNSTTHVFCSSTTCNNIEFWKTHGDNFRGFCVEIDCHAIHADIFNKIFFGGPVQYVSSSSEQLTHHFIGRKNYHFRKELMIDLFTTKYDNYSFENEYRLIIIDMSSLKDSEAPKFTNKFIVPEKGFSAVIFGQNIDPKHEEEIRKVCIENHLKVIFQRAVTDGVSIRIDTIL